MTRTAAVLLAVGTALFVALIAWQGFGAVASTLAAAGWGLAVVTAFHALPLALDAAAIAVLIERDRIRRPMRDSVVARWIGESVNSLFPAGQIGGPLMMVRMLAQRGIALPDAAAAITVSTTLQLFAQIAFALLGIALFSALFVDRAVDDAVGHVVSHAVGNGVGNVVGNAGSTVLVALAALALAVIAFVIAQRRGLFGSAMRVASRLFGRDRWSALQTRADAVDAAVLGLYGQRRRVVASFVLSLVGWIVGTGEVWLALRFLGHPVSWLDALLLESVGQAIRGAAFAIPGALGAQEGGYLLLAPLVGLPPEVGLALSLAKRTRELALGLPGLFHLQLRERREQDLHRRTARVVPVE